MNVVSVFDGISCGYLALIRAGIKVDNYFASEIDKYAKIITQSNNNKIKQIGDISKVKFFDGNLIYGKKFQNIGKVDLFIGGSPCQSFSSAGDGTGFDGKSGLFWEYVRVLEEIKTSNPNVLFLLENVKMKKEWEHIITKTLNVEPIEINSRLVSAQNRKRLYWTNINNIEQPKDKNIILSDILEKEVPDKFFLSQKAIDYMGRLRNDKPRWDYHKNPIDGKAACLTANMYKGVPYGVLRLPKMEQISVLEMKGNDSIKRVYTIAGKSPTLTTSTGGHRQPKIYDHEKEVARKLTPLECERLQTLPDNYTEGVSNTQRYKAIGNGWTVDVIAHIFKNIKKK